MLFSHLRGTVRLLVANWPVALDGAQSHWIFPENDLGLVKFKLLLFAWWSYW